MPIVSTPFNLEHAGWQQGVRRQTTLRNEHPTHQSQQYHHQQQQSWQSSHSAHHSAPAVSTVYRYHQPHQPHRPQQPLQQSPQQSSHHSRLSAPRPHVFDAAASPPAAPAKWLSHSLESARLQQLPHADGYYRVTRPIDPASVTPLNASAPLPHTARPACAFSPSAHAPFSRSQPLPLPPSMAGPTPPLTARTSHHAGPIRGASSLIASRAPSVVEHTHPRGLFPTHTFHRSSELQALPDPSVRPPSSFVAQLPGRANPSPFAAPPLADVLNLDSVLSARVFPARIQCSATRFRENLLRHDIHINFN